MGFCFCCDIVNSDYNEAGIKKMDKGEFGDLYNCLFYYNWGIYLVDD